MEGRGGRRGVREGEYGIQVGKVLCQEGVIWGTF